MCTSYSAMHREFGAPLRPTSAVSAVCVTGNRLCHRERGKRGLRGNGGRAERPRRGVLEEPWWVAAAAHGRPAQAGNSTFALETRPAVFGSPPSAPRPRALAPRAPTAGGHRGRAAGSRPSTERRSRRRRVSLAAGLALPVRRVGSRARIARLPQKVAAGNDCSSPAEIIVCSRARKR